MESSGRDLRSSQGVLRSSLQLFRDRASTAEAPLENERSLVSQTAEKREEIFAYNEELRSVAQMLHSVRSELDVHLLNNSPTFISEAVERDVNELHASELRLFMQYKRISELIREARLNLVHLLVRARTVSDEATLRPASTGSRVETNRSLAESPLAPLPSSAFFETANSSTAASGMNSNANSPFSSADLSDLRRSQSVPVRNRAHNGPSAFSSASASSARNSLFNRSPQKPVIKNVKRNPNEDDSGAFGLRRGLSFKPAPEPLREEEVGIVQGLRTRSLSKPQTGYHFVNWAIGFDEIVQEDNVFVKTNSYGAEVFRMRCRGMTMMGLAFPEPLVAEKLSHVDKYELLKGEGEEIVLHDSPLVAHVYGVCTEENHLIFGREWFPNGSLEDILFDLTISQTPKYKLSFWRKMNIAQSAAEALNVALEQRCTNPNLKLTNILFTDQWEIKLADQWWRGCKVLFNPAENDRPIDSPSLVKEFGILLWELVTERDGNHIRKWAPVDLPEHCPPKLRKLILDCCADEVAKRPLIGSLSDPGLFDAIFYEVSDIGLHLCESMWRNLSKCDTETPTTLEFRCLSCMLDCDKNRGLVTAEAFARLVKCIGPFIDGGEIIDQLNWVIRWFMGAISAGEAERLIAPIEGRPFLVRFSSSSGDYSITFKQKGKSLHSRVPLTAKYNLHQYVHLLQNKKKFLETPPSPFAHVFQSGSNVLYHSWKFIR